MSRPGIDFEKARSAESLARAFEAHLRPPTKAEEEVVPNESCFFGRIWSTMNPKERIEVLENAPPDSWVALSEDESHVLGIAATYGEAVELATKAGVEDPVLIKTPKEWF